nr:MAG TPA: hypothetical protein [Caudoviricetes sp.]
MYIILSYTLWLFIILSPTYYITETMFPNKIKFI